MGLRVYRKRSVLRVSRVAIPGGSMKINGRATNGAIVERWGVFAGRELIAVFPLKHLALGHAVARAKDLWRIDHVPAQVVIHTANGRIQSERSYPDRTPRRKG